MNVDPPPPIIINLLSSYGEIGKLYIIQLCLFGRQTDVLGQPCIQGFLRTFVRVASLIWAVLRHPSTSYISCKNRAM